MALVARTPGTVPVKTVKAPRPPKTPGGLGTPPVLTQLGNMPWPTLGKGVSPTSMFTKLQGTDWAKAATTALLPGYKTGMSSIEAILSSGLGQASSKAAALQGAYLAAGGAMPRVGSEFTSLGSTLSDFAKGAAAGTVPQSGAASLAAAGAPGFVAGSVPTDTSPGQAYMYGALPGQALAKGGYYSDVGSAATAAAQQMQGREQAMALHNQLSSEALQSAVSQAGDLASQYQTAIPKTAIDLSTEARAQAAGTLSGYQFATEQRLNIQTMLSKYAQMRADAKTNAQKLALDRWAQQQLNAYHQQMAGAANTRANTAAVKATQPKQLSASDKARLTKMAHTMYNGVQPDYKLITDTDPLTRQVTRKWVPVQGTGESALQWEEALNQLVGAGASKGYAIQLLEAQGWKHGEGGRPPTVEQKQGANILAGTASGATSPLGGVGPPGLFGQNWPNYSGG